MPSQTLNTKRCWCKSTDATWGFASAQTWLLCLLKIPSRVKYESSVNNTTAGKSGFSVRWWTNQWICLDEGNRWGLVGPAPSADGMDGDPARVQLCTQDDNPHRIRHQPRECLWRDSSQNAAHHPHQMRRAKWSSSPCAVPIHCICTSFP